MSEERVLEKLDELIAGVGALKSRLDVQQAVLDQNLAALRKTDDDHEVRLREVERQGVKMAAQAAIIAAIVGIVVPLIIKFAV